MELESKQRHRNAHKKLLLLLLLLLLLFSKLQNLTCSYSSSSHPHNLCYEELGFFSLLFCAATTFTPASSEIVD
jgi:hypothetical protein